MKVTPTSLPDVLTIEPQVFRDHRGFFFESFNERGFREAVGRDVHFVQDNQSRSVRNVLRGLHYQLQHPQGKLVRVTSGVVFDVAVDLRRRSPHFGQWASATLSAENMQQLWIPEGFAHGFVVLSGTADFAYKTTDYWHANDEHTIRWDDAELAIAWPAGVVPNLSPKDAQGKALREAEVFA